MTSEQLRWEELRIEASSLSGNGSGGQWTRLGWQRRWDAQASVLSSQLLSFGYLIQGALAHDTGEACLHAKDLLIIQRPPENLPHVRLWMEQRRHRIVLSLEEHVSKNLVMVWIWSVLQKVHVLKAWFRASMLRGGAFGKWLGDKSSDLIYKGFIVYWHYWEVVETKRWGLTGGSGSLRLCSWRVYLVPGLLHSTSASWRPWD
jgi:hypothetical protein